MRRLSLASLLVLVVTTCLTGSGCGQSGPNGTGGSSANTGGMEGTGGSSVNAGGMGGMSGSTSSTGGMGGMSGSTSSTGGMGGMGGSGGTGGAGGGGTACVTANDCPLPADACAVRTCDGGKCGTANLPAGTKTATQTPGDCKENRCDGNGVTVAVDDDTDAPGDNEACTKDLCASGTASHPPEAVGTACSEGAGVLCDGAGKCVGCVAPTDCAGNDTECRQRACSATGTCGETLAPLGKELVTQTPNDCVAVVCDGKGGTTTQPDNLDVPEDNNACTVDLCTNGIGSHTNVANGTACGGSLTCFNGACSGCSKASDCPGVDDECKTRTCAAGACGFNFAANGTAVAAQTPGDCKKVQCDGAGNTVSVADNADLPADDGNACTSEVCNAGAPSHPSKTNGTPCSDGNACTQADSCQAGVCASGSPVVCAAQDQCHLAGSCDLSTGLCSNPTKSDGAPCSDGNACTQVDSCQAGVCAGSSPVVCAAQDQCHLAGSCDLSTGLCSNPAKSDGAACNDGSACTQVDSCQAGVCAGSSPVVCTAQDQCHLAGSCDGVTGLCSNPAKSDGVACNDGNACTQADSCQAGVCASGSPVVCTAQDQCHLAGTCDGATGTCSNPSAADGTTCSSGGHSGACFTGACATCFDGAKNGNETDVDCGGSSACPTCAAGQVCNGNADCQSNTCSGGVCGALTQVASTAPADGAAGTSVSTAIAVTFTVAMNPATLTAQTTAGACSGNIQVSTNDFSQCIAFTAATATMSAGNTTATLTPARNLFAGTTYRIRVTTGATSATSTPLTATYTQAAGFATLAGASACDGNLVISQVYGGGGNSGAKYKNDFVELHNRGTTPVSLSGLSLQYTSSTNTSWASNKVDLNTVTVPAGGFYLVQLSSGGTAGAALPTPDQTWALDISGTAGKMALVKGTAGLAVNTCPDANRVLDFVGYGTTANCFEGTAAAPAPSNTLAVLRGEVGCADTNANNTNFTAVAPAPRNSSTSASSCTCNAAVNEVNTAAEADFCVLQFPTTFSTPPATTVYGRIFETGTTPTATAAAPNVIAQFGYGPVGSDPRTSTTWFWYSASFNAGFTDPSNDEYQYTFTGAATPGMYRYTYRFSFDGLQWTYCDTDGAGSNTGVDFSSTLLGTMTSN